MPARVTIRFATWCPGSGDNQDSPEIQEDVVGDWYRVEYHEPGNPARVMAGGGYFGTLAEALSHVERGTHGTVRWQELPPAAVQPAHAAGEGARLRPQPHWRHMTGAHALAAPRPITVRVLAAIIKFLMVASGVYIALSIGALKHFTDPFFEAIRLGFLDHLGVTDATYTLRQAGREAGSSILFLLLAFWMWRALEGHRLVSLRIAAGVYVLFALQQLLSLPLAIIVLILSLDSTTAAYCQRGTDLAAYGPDT